ncbi:MAG: type IV toxin-antitoxin system AbiEi family antitoxin domain-containing protein [Bryobacteraceae bacterium]
MDFTTRSLSQQESRIVLALAEQRRREVGREDIVRLLGASRKAADHVIHSLRRKGWLARASWGKYLLIPPEQGPDALGESNLLALASRIVELYYIGYSTAAAHYGLTTQHRNVIWLVTPAHVRDRRIGDGEVRVVNPAPRKFFGFGPIDILGYQVILSDREKTAIDCVDRPDLAGGVGEAAYILATASRRFDWAKAAAYLERMSSTALARRFGWVADHVGADIPATERERLLRLAAGSSKAFLGPRGEVKGAIGYNKTWRLFVNVTQEDLSSSTGLGLRHTVKRET